MTRVTQNMSVDMKTSKALNLAEFLIRLFFLIACANSDVNVALHRPATQNSTYRAAGLATDGNNDTNWFHGSCSQTNDGPGGPNWWMVDLGQPIHIRSVVITNRGDSPIDANRLDYFIVGVTNNSATPVRGCYALCGQYPSTAANGARLSLQCNPSTASGQYVIVQQPQNGPGWLTMCEIEIYAGQVRQTDSWERKKDQRLVTNGGVSTKKRSAIMCTEECKRTLGCQSINYAKLSSSCELNFLPQGAVQCDLVNASGWDWWTKRYEFV